MTLGIVAQTCDNVAVMYAGEIIELGTAEDIFTHSKHHPYTDGLFASLPNLKSKTDRLQPIAGLMPDPPIYLRAANLPRCGKCMEICKEVPPEVYTDGTPPSVAISFTRKRRAKLWQKKESL